MAEDAEYEATWPDIPWREPVVVDTIDHPGEPRYYGCRLCIARFGLRGQDVDKLYKTRDEFDEHMARFH